MSKENTKPNIRKDIGELLILGIYLFAEVWAFWELSHALCLFLAWLGILALILYSNRLSARRSLVAMVIVTAFLVAVDWIAPPILPPEPCCGWLQPPNEPTPPNIFGEEPK